MIVLGIDPGVATIGFGVLDAQRGKNTLIQYGVITTPAGLPLSRRLRQIHADMEQLIRQFKPDEMAVEELFFSKNITTGISVAHGRGVILLAAEQLGVPVFEYTPMQVKQAVVGYGAAEKRQVMLMTQRLLGMKQIPKPDDAADALAIAICHSRAATSLMNTERVFDAGKYDTR
ncbi:MAG: crossover junction endodeoxyribonuclease RuvC [Oscillospiraceae bacterium]|nr:crossover junction endodeoxyribonuclease RuvC [Oscillospiraceae bacterium]